MFGRTVSAIIIALLLTSTLTLAFHIQPVETELPPLTGPEESAAMQGSINLDSQEIPQTEWNKTCGGTGDDEAYALVQTTDGGYALAGSTTSFGAGMADFWLVKTDAAGNMQWNRTYGGTNDDVALALVQTADGGYALTGITWSFGAGYVDSWLVKTDASGNAQWNQTYGGTGIDVAASLVQTGDGGYALAGNTQSFGAGWNDFWLVKTDAAGNMQWNTTYGGTNWDGASALVQTSDGGYALAGNTGSFGAGMADFWLVKTDAAGNMQWNRTYGGTDDDLAYALVQTTDGGYALAGGTGYTGLSLGFDSWLVKTDALGNMQWNQTYMGTTWGVRALVQTADGGYALAGKTAYWPEDNDAFWLVKTDASGTMQWLMTSEGLGGGAYALVQTTDGGYALAGSTDSFGAGGYDFWLVKARAVDVEPRTWTVDDDGPADFHTIQEAINNANDGDTVFVRNGTYHEILQWDKLVSLIGENCQTTFVDGEGEFIYGLGLINLEESNIIVSGLPTIVSGFTICNHGGDWADFPAGIYSGGVRNCRIFGNRIVNNTNGIILDVGSADISVSENIISDNQVGLWVATFRAGTNRIYHNDFENIHQVALGFYDPYPFFEVWDDGYPLGGNYWSDYTGVDANGDGIGDTAYVINANNTDRYPLINPWSARDDSFRFPLDGPWTVRQRFGGYNYDWNGYHLGEDVLRSFEAPVFAPADGIVKHNMKRTGYGYVVIIEHQLMDGTSVCSVLGHLREADRAQVGATVTEGQMVGYLSSVPEENGGIIHLHFGIRKGLYSEELDFDGKWRYRGYGPIDIVGSWCPPSAFIEYYNENKETPPSYDLTINTEGGGAAARSTLVYTLTFKTLLSLIASHSWFQRWSGTDNDNVNPTTAFMDRIRDVTQWLLSEPPPPCPTPWELAKELANEKADYSLGGGCGWNWTMIWAGDPPELVLYGWPPRPGETKKWLEANEIKEGYYFYKDTTGKVQLGKGVDCSGLVFWAYNKAWGARPEAMLTKIGPESKRENINPIEYYGANMQYRGSCHIAGVPDITKDQLQPGDLLFFDTPDPKNLDPDHVAMYVGGPFQYSYGDGKTFDYNCVESTIWGDKIVTVAFYDPATENMATLQPSTGNLRDPPLHVKYYGRPHHQMDNKPLSFTCGSPVDLMVTDPDGIVLTKEIGEIAGMSYTEFDLDGDGELDDNVEVWAPKAGNYLITVIPEPGAPPTGNFTLEASISGTTILLADHAQISEIPADPYIITQNGTAIMLRNINIAATNVTSSKSVVGQGYLSSINVTVQNQGTLEETFNVTLYANTTMIASQAVTLTSGNFTTINFTWNTTGFAKGNYTLSAYAWPVPDETNMADNNFTGGWVIVSLVGDITGPDGWPDGKVNMYDVGNVARRFMAKPPSPDYNPNFDINGDGVINMIDIGTVARHFGETSP